MGHPYRGRGEALGGFFTLPLPLWVRYPHSVLVTSATTSLFGSLLAAFLVPSPVGYQVWLASRVVRPVLRVLHSVTVLDPDPLTFRLVWVQPHHPRPHLPETGTHAGLPGRYLGTLHRHRTYPYGWGHPPGQAPTGGVCLSPR